MSHAEPHFDTDYKFGRPGELRIEELLHWIANGSKQVEVKTKRIFDLHFYIETDCDKGCTGIYRPSGISITTAQVWAFCIGQTGISVMVPTDLIREMLDDASTRDKEERDGSCPTRGKLISLPVLLYRIKKRSEPKTPKVTTVSEYPEQVARVVRDLLVHEIRWDIR